MHVCQCGCIEALKGLLLRSICIWWFARELTWCHLLKYPNNYANNYSNRWGHHVTRWDNLTFLHICQYLPFLTTNTHGKWINLDGLCKTGLCGKIPEWISPVIEVFMGIFTFWVTKCYKYHISVHIYPFLSISTLSNNKYTREMDQF